MPLSESEELEMLELMEKESMAPVSVDKKISTIGRIAGETSGALAGELLGAQIGSAVPGIGTLAGGYVGGALGAGAATYGMDIAEGKSKMEAAKSAAVSAGSQLVVPAVIRKAAPVVGKVVSSVMDEIPKSLGWMSGLGRSSVERIQKNPKVILDNLDVTDYDLKDAAKIALSKVDEEIKAYGTIQNVPKELLKFSDDIKFIVSDANPKKALAHVLKKSDDSTNLVIKDVTDDLIGKQIALEAKDILGNWGVKEATAPMLSLVSYGLLGTGLLPIGAAALAKSPTVAAGVAVGETVAKKLAEKAIEKTPEIAKQAAARVIPASIEQDLKE